VLLTADACRWLLLLLSPLLSAAVGRVDARALARLVCPLPLGKLRQFQHPRLGCPDEIFGGYLQAHEVLERARSYCSVLKPWRQRFEAEMDPDPPAIGGALFHASID
jgi:hypothetical protein